MQILKVKTQAFLKYNWMRWHSLPIFRDNDLYVDFNMKHQDNLNPPAQKPFIFEHAKSFTNLVLNRSKRAKNGLFSLFFDYFWTYLRISHGGPNDLLLKHVSLQVKKTIIRPLGGQNTSSWGPSGYACGGLFGAPRGLILRSLAYCGAFLGDYYLFGPPWGSPAQIKAYSGHYCGLF